MRAPRVRFEGLWRHGDFLRLWAGQTVSLFGSEVSVLAIPLAAALTLEASATEMGILAATSRAPYLFIGLFAGVWVDRLARRPILIAAEVGRGVLIGSIPVVALLDRLTIEYLYVVMLLAGTLTVFFDVAYQSFLPSLVPRERLVEGNSKLETSRSAAWIAGPGVAGWLVQVLGAPLAVAFDALTFAVSGTLLWLIRVKESVATASRERRGVWAELTEGLRFGFRNPYLRAIAGSSATSNLFDAVQLAVFVLYVTRDLEITPGVLGLILATGNVGLLLGALGVGRVTERFGMGRTILWAAVIMGLARVLVPMAAGPIEAAVTVLVLAQFGTSLGRMLYNVSHLSLRQAITPDAMLGRVNASMRFVAWGAVPLGALVGGLLGEAIGLRAALVVGGVGGLLAIAWIQLSPVPSISRDPPEPKPGLEAETAS